MSLFPIFSFLPHTCILDLKLKLIRVFFCLNLNVIWCPIGTADSVLWQLRVFKSLYSDNSTIVACLLPNIDRISWVCEHIYISHFPFSMLTEKKSIDWFSFTNLFLNMNLSKQNVQMLCRFKVFFSLFSYPNFSGLIITPYSYLH